MISESACLPFWVFSPANCSMKILTGRQSPLVSCKSKAAAGPAAAQTAAKKTAAPRFQKPRIPPLYPTPPKPNAQTCRAHFSQSPPDINAAAKK